MANSLKGKFWILDTTGVVTARQLYVKRINWFKPTNVGDSLIIKDRNGNIILNNECEVANQTQTYLMEVWWEGLTLDTLSSGTVQVQLE